MREGGGERGRGRGLHPWGRLVAGGSPQQQLQGGRGGVPGAARVCLDPRAAPGPAGPRAGLGGWVAPPWRWRRSRGQTGAGRKPERDPKGGGGASVRAAGRRRQARQGAPLLVARPTRALLRPHSREAKPKLLGPRCSRSHPPLCPAYPLPPAPRPERHASTRRTHRPPVLPVLTLMPPRCPSLPRLRSPPRPPPHHLGAGKLSIVKTGNAATPMVTGWHCVLVADVWEHA